jgi:hypothetical protein
MLTLRLLLPAVVLLAVSLQAKSARADMPVSLDLDYVLPVDEGPIGDGFGGALRFGPRMDLAILNLAAEASLGVHDMSGPAGPTVYRGTIGSRFGLGVLLRPSIYGHVGVGHVDFDNSDDLTHLTLDVGAALDLALLPSVELGAHAAYNFIFGNGSINDFGFMAIGGHLTIVLDRDD